MPKRIFILPLLFMSLACAGKASDAMKYYSEGKIHYSQNDLPSAEKCFREACRLDRTLLNARLMLSKIHYYRKEFARALVLQNEILKEDEDHPGALYWKARTLAVHSSGQPLPESMKCLTRLLELDSHHIPARLLLALLYEKNEKYGDAVREYRSALLEEQALVSARGNLSVLYHRLGLKARSREELGIALQIARAAGLPDEILNKIKQEIE